MTTTISQALAVPEIKALVEAAKEGLTGLVWAMDHLAQHGTVSVSVAVAYDRLDAALAALDPAALATMLAEARNDALREAAGEAAGEVAAHGCGELAPFLRRRILALIKEPQT